MNVERTYVFMKDYSYTYIYPNFLISRDLEKVFTPLEVNTKYQE